VRCIQRLSERAVGQAQASTDQLQRDLEALVMEGDREPDGREIDADWVRTARDQPSEASERAEGIALGTNVREIWERVLEVKTRVDFADAYLRAALWRYAGMPADEELRTDEQIQRDVRDELHESPEVQAPEVDVEVDDGISTMSTGWSRS
jgi:hypothetical protein